MVVLPTPPFWFAMVMILDILFITVALLLPAPSKFPAIKRLCAEDW
ncbi:hypothetical protein CES86_2165 [Brucella lupini]|uniref:Uncharacterized protein n=1 Tax=Brucella lupini TaxID=255457 RepID=A0A256GSP2_9HYPH|nr:hypothetical protein CES86_2165 [Brucella lupini]